MLARVKEERGLSVELVPVGRDMRIFPMPGMIHLFFQFQVSAVQIQGLPTEGGFWNTIWRKYGFEAVAGMELEWRLGLIVSY